MTATPCNAGGVKRLWGSTRAVAMTEFALVLPLLILMFAISVECGRIYNAYRSLGQAANSIGRELAQFPEYDKRARDYAPPLAAALLPGGTTENFNLQVTGLRRNGSGFTQNFTHTLLGTDPGIPWSGTVDPANYDQSEPVIHIAATYTYRPIFASLLPVGTITLRRTFVTMPFFSRDYVWDDTESEDKYVY